VTFLLSLADDFVDLVGAASSTLTAHGSVLDIRSLNAAPSPVGRHARQVVDVNGCMPKHFSTHRRTPGRHDVI